jgi:hypothetical protein
MLVNLFNHNPLGQRSLEDVIAIFGHQVKALGHQFVWDKDNNSLNIDGVRGGAYNVIVEGFTPSITSLLARGYANGARYVCLATEEPTPSGFNHGLQKEMRWRQEEFPNAAKFFDAIFHLVPGKHVTDWYSQYAPSSYVELGYAPSLVRGNWIEPEFDFGFYGSVSTRRYRILRQMQNRHPSRKIIHIVADFRSQVERDREMQRCRVILQLRKHDQMGLVSSSRCGTALCLGRPIVAESHELSKPWDEIVRFTRDDEELFDLAFAVKGAWRGVHADQFETFKMRLPPEACVGAAIDSLRLNRVRAA